MARKSKFTQEMKERAVRLVLEHSSKHSSRFACIQSVAVNLGCTAQTEVAPVFRSSEDVSFCRPAPIHERMEE